MQRSEIIRFLILRTIGNFLLLFAIFGVLATFGPSLYYEAQFKIVQARGIQYKVVDPAVLTNDSGQSTPLGELLRKQKGQGFTTVLAGPKEQILIPKDTDFSVLIPKIGINSKVFPNVDASNQNDFLPLLQKGVAHAQGTVFPGMPGNIYLFAHSTDNFWDVGRYNAVFYLLKDLSIGDSIVVFFEDRRYNYTVSEVRIVDASDISYIVKAQEGEETLILQTCWPPGTTWKRLLVFAKRR
ncbi:MAG: sortase [Candidatus Levybacteria bacterium]|nr:sortase [Candidatus Levybacteria bacterium]